MMNYYGGGFGWGMPFGFGFFGFILMLLWWVLIIWGLVTFFRWAARSSGGSGSRHSMSALDIAKERYAKGDITKEEYEEIKKELIK